MLKSYAFDVDSNLVFTDTTIWIEILQDEKRIPIQISQQQYDELSSDLKKGEKFRHLNNNIEQSMKNFRGAGIFEKTIFDALSQGKIGPSRDKFIEANRYASPIGWITARGHPISELKETHKKIIYEVFTGGQREDLVYSMKERLGNYKKNDDIMINTYLNNNFYGPCSDETFLKSINKDILDPLPERKNAAFEQFVLRCKSVFRQYYGEDFLAKRKIRIGFSDDTTKNIEGLHKFIHEKNIGLMKKYPEIAFRMYDTNQAKSPPIKFSYTNEE